MRPALALTALAAAFTIATAIPTVAHADQCAWIDKATAQAAAKLLSKGRRVVDLCEPCGDSKIKPALITFGATARRVRKSTKGFWEVIVDDKPIDLAYVFVEVSAKSKVFDNVAKLVGCSTTGVSAQVHTP